MTLRLNGSTSGYVEIDAPATAGSNTLVLPTGNGTSGQALQTNGSGALSWGPGVANDGQLCKAWVNFDGTLVTNPGSATGIRASYNVSSITDNGTGDYTVNFTTAMADTNYAVAGSSSGDSGSLSGITVLDGGTYSTSAVRFVVRYAAAGSGLVDRATVAIQIFR